MLWIAYPWLTLGSLGLVGVAILVIIVTHYAKPSYTTTSYSKRKIAKESNTSTKDGTPGDGPHVNKFLNAGYSDKHLEEIARCALCLQDFDPDNVQEFGDGNAKHSKVC